MARKPGNHRHLSLPPLCLWSMGLEARGIWVAHHNPAPASLFPSLSIQAAHSSCQHPCVSWPSSICSYCFLCPDVLSPSLPVKIPLLLQVLDQTHLSPRTMCPYTVCFPPAVQHQSTSPPPLWLPPQPAILCGWVRAPLHLPVVDNKGRRCQFVSSLVPSARSCQ